MIIQRILLHNYSDLFEFWLLLNHGSFNSKSWFLSSQIHHQGAVPTLNYTVLCYDMEKKKEHGEKGHFFKIIGCSLLKGFNFIV